MLRVSLRTALDVPGPRHLSVAAQPARRTTAVGCGYRGGGESARAVAWPEMHMWPHECGHGVASAAARRKPSPSSWKPQPALGTPGRGGWTPAPGSSAFCRPS